MKLEFQFFESDSSIVESSEINEEKTLKVRLDKWLWAARFFKTRALARAAVEEGKVYYNGQRSKPSREIELGATLQIRQGRFEKVIIIKGLSTRRRSTEEALQLFEETETSREAREQTGAQWEQNGYDYQPPHRSEPHERRAVRFLRRSFTRGDNRNHSENQMTTPNFELEDES